MIVTTIAVFHLLVSSEKGESGFISIGSLDGKNIKELIGTDPVNLDGYKFVKTTITDIRIMSVSEVVINRAKELLAISEKAGFKIRFIIYVNENSNVNELKTAANKLKEVNANYCFGYTAENPKDVTKDLSPVIKIEPIVKDLPLPPPPPK